MSLRRRCHLDLYFYLAVYHGGGASRRTALIGSEVEHFISTSAGHCFGSAICYESKEFL